MRIVRARHAELASRVDRTIPFASPATPRRLVQIFNGGSMPSSPDHFFLAYPIELDGIETEGGTGTPVDDASQPIVVDVLGHAPSAGDILTAYAVGGRWVAERGQSSGGGSLACSPCNIPAQNLILSWVNAISGNGSTALTYATAPASWTSGCSNGLIYKLLCTGGEVELRVIYFTAGILSHRHATVLFKLAGHALRPDPFQLHMLAILDDFPFQVRRLPGDHQQRIYPVHDHVVEAMDNRQRQRTTDSDATTVQPRKAFAAGVSTCVGSAN